MLLTRCKIEQNKWSFYIKVAMIFNNYPPLFIYSNYLNGIKLKRQSELIPQAFLNSFAERVEPVTETV